MSLFPVLFAVYWSSVLVWCLMASRLCDGLSRRHPLVFDALGRPAPLAGSGLRGDFALLRFLLDGRYRLLEDRRLVRLCGAMRVLLCAYVLFFFSFPALILGCASAPPAGWEQVRIIEKNEEGMEHLALPTHLEGCEYLGAVRSQSPPAGQAEASIPDLKNELRMKAARKGGDTVAVLPGVRVVRGVLRGSVFRCGETAQP